MAMTPEPHHGWLSRTLGWSGSRSQWLSLAGASVWIAGLFVIGAMAQSWSIGKTLFAYCAWLLVLSVVCRDAVRDLFGPVFFYDLLRVSRNPTTFVLRGLYGVAFGGLLLIMYFEWMQSYGSNDPILQGELALTVAIALAICGGLIWKSQHGRAGAMILVMEIVIALLVVLLLIVSLGKFMGIDSRTYTVDFDTVSPSRVSRFANTFFEVSVVIQWVVMALLTPVYVAPTIAVEKECKTLEFLFATDLRNREIIFGKLLSRVMTLVAFVLAGLPLLAFLQLFGGIDPEQLLAATIATVTLVLGLSAMSIWVSTSIRRAREAIMLSYLCMAAYVAVSWLLAAASNAPFGALFWWNTPIYVAGYSIGINDVLAFVADGNPLWAVTKMSMRGAFAGIGLGAVLRDFLIFWGVAGSFFLGTAILRLRRVALAQAYGPVQRRSLFIHPKAKGDDRRSERRDRSARRPAIGSNPVLWKEVFVDSNYRGGCIGVFVGLVILGLVLVPLILITYFEFFERSYIFGGQATFAMQWQRYQEEINGWVRITTGVLGTLLFLSAAMRGAGAITGEKDKDTWISLIGTPMSAEEILIGKWWGCVLSLRRGFMVMLGVWAVGFAIGAIHVMMLPIMLLLTAVYISAFSWIGIWCSLISRNTMVASTRGVFAALVACGGFWLLLGLCCFMPMSIADSKSDLAESFGTFMLGFTPPVVYGIFPLRILDADELGPFDGDRRRSAGLLGPIIGTCFWIVFSLMMKLHCESLMRRLTNREPRSPRAAPRRIGDSED
jgi:ABC-type transport system involved in multi-copper enzyme maturation permease subunit